MKREKRSFDLGSMRYLAGGFTTLVPLSFSRDAPDAGSTCRASSMRPVEGLQERRSIRDISSGNKMSFRKEAYFLLPLGS